MPETVTKTEYKPFTMTKKQLASEEFAFVNGNKSVMIERIADGRIPGSYLLKGYVESKERKGTYFQVDIVISDSKHNSIPWSNCTCTSAHYRSNPCHHALRMRDVFLANRNNMLKAVMRR
jgi:hypothetical protein